MWSRFVLAAAIGLLFASGASAEPLLHRASCPAAEAWARNNGAPENEIEAARRCIKDAPVQSAQISRAALN